VVTRIEKRLKNSCWWGGGGGGGGRKIVNCLL